jgi:hypothetical protein
MLFRQCWRRRTWNWSRCSSNLSTIFALATGSQIRSGVAIIRVSGSSATQSLLALTKQRNIETLKPNQLYLRNLYHHQTKDLIDQCMIVWFKGRRSSHWRRYICEPLLLFQDRKASPGKMWLSCKSSKARRLLTPLCLVIFMDPGQ